MTRKSRYTEQQTKADIWNGIVQRAVADGDYSLVDLAYPTVKKIHFLPKWGRIAAAVLLLSVLGYSLYNMSQHVVLSEKQLAQTFQDTAGRSIIRLSNGKTVVLNGSNYSDSILGLDTRSKNGLDYRRVANLSEAVETHIFETTRGKQDHFTLADGTVVWVNAGSKVTFPTRFEGVKRIVQLEGEAYFEVAHDKTKPFIVMTDKQKIEVLGTHFNVRSYRDEQDKEVVLLEGSVQVVHLQQPSRKAVLKPDQRLTLVANGDYKLDQVPNPDFFTAWRDGEFSFQDTEVGLVIKELERWYPVEITVDNEDRKKRISGKMRKDWSMKEVKEALQYFDIKLQVSMK